MSRSPADVKELQMTETVDLHEEGAAFWHQPHKFVLFNAFLFSSFGVQFVQLCLTITAGSP